MVRSCVLTTRRVKLNVCFRFYLLSVFKVHRQAAFVNLPVSFLLFLLPSFSSSSSSSSSSHGSAARYLVMVSPYYFFLQSLLCPVAARKFSVFIALPRPSAPPLPMCYSGFRQAFFHRDFFPEFVSGMW